MNLTIQALQIIIFLLPGFITLYVARSLIAYRPKPELDKIIEALIYSLINYAVFTLFSNLFPISAIIKSLEEEKKLSIEFNRKAFLLILIISFSLGIIIAIFKRYDLHMKFFRLIRVSNKTSRSSVCQDIFIDQKAFVTVYMEDGLRIIGWPTYVSDDPEDGYIFLSDAAWIKDNDGVIEIKGPGILITPTAKIQAIEFISGEEEKNNGKK
jgi:hypothetical protein